MSDPGKRAIPALCPCLMQGGLLHWGQKGDGSMDQQKIGALLKQLRKERALTQEQLAAHFGVSGRSVSRWENGNNLPDLATLVELADFYGVEIRALLDGEGGDEAVKPEEKATMMAVVQYTDEEKSGLLARMHRLFLAGLAGFVCALAIPALGLEEVTPFGQAAYLGLGFAFGMLVVGAVFTSRWAKQIRDAKLRLRRAMKR